MEPTSVNHGPLIVGLAAIGVSLLGTLFAGGVAWGRINTRTTNIEKYIEKHEQWSSDRSDVVDELKNITTRLDAILETRVLPFIEHHERRDELER